MSKVNEPLSYRDVVFLLSRVSAHEQKSRVWMINCTNVNSGSSAMVGMIFGGANFRGKSEKAPKINLAFVTAAG